MNVLEQAVVTSVGGLLLSMLTSLLIVAFSYGRLTSRVDAIERGRADLATKADLQAVSDKITEISGMFKLVLKDGHDS